MRLVATHAPAPFPRERAGHSLLRGVWRLADPKIALASLVPFGVGVALAWRAGSRVDLVLAAAAFLAVFLVEVGKNAVNDFYDFRSGADTEVQPEERSPFSGGKRVLVDGLLEEGDLIRIASVAFAAAAVLGILVAMHTRPALLLLGAAAALISILYAMPPVKLAYRGLGELAVFCVYGPGIVIGTVLLLGASVTGDVVATATMLGILIALVLLANEIPDQRADGVAGKRTLVVRLGRDRATSLLGFLFSVAYAIPLSLAAYGGPTWIVGGLAGAPVAAFAYWSLRRQAFGPPVVAQTAVLVTYVVTGLGLVTTALLT